jgi:hypothetical protein
VRGGFDPITDRDNTQQLLADPRTSADCGVSPASIFPPGNSHDPACDIDGPRCAASTVPSYTMTAPTTSIGFVTKISPQADALGQHASRAPTRDSQALPKSPQQISSGMSRSRRRLRPLYNKRPQWIAPKKGTTMAKYLLLKHYRGAPAATNDVPMDQWTRAEFDAHIKYMSDFAERLAQRGEFVDSQALQPGGLWVRYDGEGKPPVTDGPFAETKDVIAGWMIIDVESQDRAVELAGELSAAPGWRGRPLGEWLEVRPLMGETAPQSVE